MLIVSRFLKGVAAAFTAPAGLSIITTSFAEGAVRNRALAIYTATGGAGFSLGLVIGGVLTEISWRLVFFVPVVVAAAALAGGLRLIPADVRAAVGRRNLDFPGAARHYPQRCCFWSSPSLKRPSRDGALPARSCH